LRWRVFDEAATSSPSRKTLPIALVFIMTRGGGNPEYERFYLQVSIESKRRLSDYCVDVEFPSAFLITPSSIEVRERRTNSHQVLRATPEDFKRVLNPGNNNPMGIEFFVKRDASQRELMNQMVRATTSYEDIEIALEHSIAELCDKENPLVFREG
jgi:hypothetical protein